MQPEIQTFFINKYREQSGTKNKRNFTQRVTSCNMPVFTHYVSWYGKLNQWRACCRYADNPQRQTAHSSYHGLMTPCMSCCKKPHAQTPNAIKHTCCYLTLPSGKTCCVRPSLIGRRVLHFAVQSQFGPNLLILPNITGGMT